MTIQPSERWIPKDDFGDRIRRIRRQLGLGQGAFAAKIEVGEKALGSWEAGLREPQSMVAVAKRVELAFGVPAAWVLGLDQSGPISPPDPSGGAAGDGLLRPRYGASILTAVAA